MCSSMASALQVGPALTTKLPLSEMWHTYLELGVGLTSKERNLVRAMLRSRPSPINMILLSPSSHIDTSLVNQVKRQQLTKIPSLRA